MTTIFNENNGQQAGNMLDIKAQCDVYTRVGQYEVLADDWTLAQRATVIGQGFDKPTQLPMLDQSMHMTACKAFTLRSRVDIQNGGTD
jgi:hypothetical protein